MFSKIPYYCGEKEKKEGINGKKHKKRNEMQRNVLF